MKKVSVWISKRKIRMLISVSVFMLPLLNYGQITFTEVPIDKQLYARDSNNKSLVVFDGTYSDLGGSFPSYSSLRIDVRRIDNQGVETLFKSESQSITLIDNTADFVFNISIDAELASFNFQIFGEIGGSDDLLYTVDDVVSGDVYVIQGQSNAEAVKQPEETESVTSYESDFIRVFGSSTKKSDKFADPSHPDYSSSHTVWNYGKGHFQSGGLPGGIGQWGLMFAKSIIDNDGIPVAIFNGATGGKAIEYFQKDYDNSVEGNENDLNSYQRLIWRLDESSLIDKVKAVIWSQGEADATLNTTTQTYMNQFQALLDDWNTDIGGLLSKFYIFQTKSSCGTASSMLVKEAQRRLADGNTIKIIQTAGLSYINDCHFSVTNGYENFASRLYAHISIDFYGGTDDKSIYTPTLVRSYLRGPTTLIIETKSSNNYTPDLTNNNIDIADFELNSSNSVSITNISIDPDEKEKIVIELSGNPGSTVNISYLGRGYDVSNNSSNLIINSGGNELVCFNEYEVDSSLETVWNGSDWSLIDPVPTMDAVIDATYSISDGGFEARSLTINGGEDVVFDSGSSTNENIILHGDLNISTNASLTIGDTESFIMKDVFSEVNIQGNGRFIKKEKSTLLDNQYDVTYWGASAEGQSLSSVFPNVDANRIFEYKPLEENPIYTGAYEKYKHWFIASGNMIPGKGYSVDGDSGPTNPSYPRYSEIEFEGTPNYKDISIEINKFSSGSLTYDQSNLLSNPYPAAIDADALIEENIDVFKGTIYLWTHENVYESGEYEYDYLTYNRSGPGSSDIADPFYISSGQGFMILTDQSTAIFNFKNSMMIPGQNNAFYKRGKSKVQTESQKNRIWISLKGDLQKKKEILIGFFENATNGEDIGYDGELLNAEASLTFYSFIKKKKYAIQALADNPFKKKSIVSLGYSISQPGNYSISISKTEGRVSEQKIYLIDKKLKRTHELNTDNYNFHHDSSGEFNDRFKLVFSTPFEKGRVVNEKKSTIVALKNGELVLNSESKAIQLSIYDMIGRLIYKGKPDTNIFSHGIQRGSIIYTDFELENGTTIKKKIIALD